MNKEYTYIDGKAIIKDENGNQTPTEYYDNLDEVLVQENKNKTTFKNWSSFFIYLEKSEFTINMVEPRRIALLSECINTVPSTSLVG